MTLRTVPLDRVRRTWIVGAARRPAVDVDAWAVHVRLSRRPDDERALAVLTERYRAFVEAQARRFYRGRDPVEDLVQVAFEALLLALRRFDPQRRKPFLGFAKPTVIGSLQRYIRDAGWAVRVPRRVHELVGPAHDAQDLLAQDLGRPPTIGEVADFLGVDEREVAAASVAEGARATTSLDAPQPATGAGRHELLGVLDRGFVGTENRLALQAAVDGLSAEDRDLLRLYFVDGRTQSEIGDVLGCSQMQVSRLLRGVLRRMRRQVFDV